MAIGEAPSEEDFAAITLQGHFKHARGPSNAARLQLNASDLAYETELGAAVDLNCARRVVQL